MVMAFKLKLKEPLQAGVRRIVAEQLDKAIATAAGGAERVTWVHETRKSLKRLRALLRLVRSGVSPGIWREANDGLRDIARNLSPLRDSDVLLGVLQTIECSDNKKLASAVAWFEARLEARTRPGTGPADDDLGRDVVAKATADLERARERLARIDIDGELADVCGVGIATAVKAGRRALAEVEADPCEENFHELRKCVQTYWRQAGLLAAAWPEVQAPRIVAARELSQMFGQVQDLAVLAAAVAAQAGQGERRHAEHLVSACHDRQRQLVAMALPAVARLFGTPPKGVASELARCWRASAELAAATPRRRTE